MLRFRNVDTEPGQPVEQWPGEAVQAALERGSLRDWRRIAAAIRGAPWGRTARQVEQALRISRPYGVAEVMEDIIEHARGLAQSRERAQVASEINRLVRASGLSRAEFARAIGTSPSRLSTYLSGQVSPSAALMVRMRSIR